MPNASCQNVSRWDQTMQRAVEQVLDMVYEPALRFLKGRERFYELEQVEKERSPSSV